MKIVGGFFLPDNDFYFGPILERGKGFEIDHLHAALKYVKRFNMAIDGGASFGSWSVEMAKQFSIVMSFEPAKDSYDCLVANTATYPNVITCNRALGEKEGRCGLMESSTRKGNTGSRFMTVGDSVSVVRIDDYITSDLSFYKLDVEGAELAALRGAERTILNSKPVILIEQKKFKDTEGRIPVDHLAAGQYLEELGMVCVEKCKNDHIYIFKD